MAIATFDLNDLDNAFDAAYQEQALSASKRAYMNQRAQHERQYDLHRWEQLVAAGYEGSYSEYRRRLHRPTLKRSQEGKMNLSYMETGRKYPVYQLRANEYDALIPHIDGGAWSYYSVFTVSDTRPPSECGKLKLPGGVNGYVSLFKNDKKVWIQFSINSTEIYSIKLTHNGQPITEAEIDKHFREIKAIEDERQKASAKQYTKDIEKNTIEQGKDFTPNITDFAEEKETVINLNQEDSLQTRYIQVVGTVSKIDQEINEIFSLEAQAEMADGFLKARAALEEKINSKPGAILGFLDKLAGDNKLYRKAKSSTKEALALNSSTQSNIDYMFGVMSVEYDKMVDMCDKLKESRSVAIAQVKVLKDLIAESTEELAEYEDRVSIPTKRLVVDTQMKASLQIYEIKVSNLTSTIVSAETTIMSLGKDLPAIKTNMSSDSAVNSVLTSVGNWQEMFKTVSDLGANLAEATETHIYEVTKNFLQMQSSDTNTMQYIADSKQRSEKLIKMVVEETELVVQKTIKDAEFIGNLSSGMAIEDARKRHKLLT